MYDVIKMEEFDRIAKENPTLWEGRLYAIALKYEIQGIEAQINVEPVLLGNRKIESHDIAVSISEEMTKVLDCILEMNDQMKSAFTGAFGLPGQPGCVTKIIDYARITASAYRKILETMNVLRELLNHTEFAELINESDKVFSPAISNYHQYYSYINNAIDEYIAKPEIKRRGLDISLKIGIENEMVSAFIEKVKVGIIEPQQLQKAEMALFLLNQLKAQRELDYPESNEREPNNIGEGYIYLLTNPSMTGLIKIGKTTRSPKDRAKELGNGTGIPTPFQVIFEAFVLDCSSAEKYVHDKLRNFRVAERREFFTIEPSVAIRIMIEAERLFSNP